MAVLDNIMRKTQEVGKVIADTATEVYDYTKVSYNIAALENKQKQALAALGAYVLETENGAEPDEEKYNELLAAAKEIDEQIATAKGRRSEIKNETICSNCGKANAKDSAYCSSCGAKINE